VLDISLKEPRTNEVIGESPVTLRLEQGAGKPAKISGLLKFVNAQEKSVVYDFFVSLRGGEFFFVPSIPVLTAWGNE
jgi:hypothetical protein